MINNMSGKWYEERANHFLKLKDEAQAQMFFDSLQQRIKVLTGHIEKIIQLDLKASHIYLYIYYAIQIGIGVGAILTSVLVSLSPIPKVATIIISITVGILTVIANTLKFGEKSAILNRTRIAMLKEYNAFATSTEDYQNLTPGAAIDLLMSRFNKIGIDGEQQTHALEFAKVGHTAEAAKEQK